MFEPKVDTGHKALLMDVGGSHIGSILLALGEVSAPELTRTPLDHTLPRPELLSAFERAARAALGADDSRPLPELLWEAGVVVAALGIPGPFDYELGVSRMEHKFAALNGLSLRRELAALFGLPERSILFANDAAAFGLGEANFGVGRNYRRIIALTLGTGIGSAFCVDGHLVTNGHGVPPGGEIWNHPYKHGIVEDQISTCALISYYKNFSGEETSAREIAERARTYDAAARAAWRQFGSLIGSVSARVCADFHPDLIVLGGAMAQSADLFLPAARMRLRGLHIRIKPSTLFDRATMLGLSLHANSVVK